MKTKLATLSMMVFSAWLTPAATYAGPGDAYDEPTRLSILDARSVSCSPRGSLCIRPGDELTRAGDSPAMASLGRQIAMNDVPRFTRVQPGRGGAVRANDSAPWTLQVDARLRQAAISGNTLFLLWDVKDRKALEDKQVTALWQAPIVGTDRLSARMALSPDDGFRPGHTYHIRVAQLIGGKEVVLAEGMVGLD